MRVLVASWDDDPPVGGQGVYVSRLRAALAARGHDVVTVAGRGPHRIAYPRVTGRGHLDLSLRLTVSPRPLIEAGADIVHLSGGPGGLVVLRRLPVPVVYTVHHTHAQSTGHPRARKVFSRWEARSYGAAAAIAADSRSTADALVAMGIRPSSVSVVHPGPGTAAPAPSGVGNGARARSMLFAGRLEPEKGPLDALAVMERITSTVPDAAGVVVGDGSLAGIVRDRAARTSGRIRFLGRCDDRRLAAEYLRARVVLMPSAFEGIGLVALEAMTGGAAVVGYDVTGLRDAIAGHGVLVPRGDCDAMASAVEKLLVDDAYCATMARDARAAATREHSWERCAADIEALYETALNRTPCS